jgi:hypothetical protein
MMFKRLLSELIIAITMTAVACILGFFVAYTTTTGAEFAEAYGVASVAYAVGGLYAGILFTYYVTSAEGRVLLHKHWVSLLGTSFEEVLTHEDGVTYTVRYKRLGDYKYYPCSDQLMKRKR